MRGGLSSAAVADFVGAGFWCRPFAVGFGLRPIRDQAAVEFVHAPLDVLRARGRGKAEPSLFKRQ